MDNVEWKAKLIEILPLAELKKKNKKTKGNDSIKKIFGYQDYGQAKLTEIRKTN